MGFMVDEVYQARRERDQATRTCVELNERLAQANKDVAEADEKIAAQDSHRMVLESRIRSMTPEKQFRVVYPVQRRGRTVLKTLTALSTLSVAGKTTITVALPK